MAAHKELETQLRAVDEQMLSFDRRRDFHKASLSDRCRIAALDQHSLSR